MQRYIPRKLEARVADSLTNFPVTALLGPRQCGKSTLAKHLVQKRSGTVYLDLEKPSDLRKLTDAEFFFSTHKDRLICIDEVQKLPDLFPVIRVAADENHRSGSFLLLGSASPDLIQKSSETLAGRIKFLELTPFTFEELRDCPTKKYDDVLYSWQRGGFPRSILAPSDRVSYDWRESFIRTFLERDIPQLGFSIPALTMRRFWMMLAHYHGQLLNTSKLGQALDTSRPTIRKYLDILEHTFLVRLLPPLETNLKKRMVKSPKVYIRDSGILHALLEIENMASLLGHPVVGASWEGWCIEQVTAALPRWRTSFYRTSSGEEIDLIIEKGTTRLAFEFKASMAPKLSRGFPETIKLLQPTHSWVVAPVKDSYLLKSNVKVCNPDILIDDLKKFQ